MGSHLAEPCADNDVRSQNLAGNDTGSDAHRGSDFHWLQLGVDQARRGWLQKDDVLNTLPLPALRRRLAASMGR